MAVSGHLLILLIPVLSLCGATEFYVRPTEPTNTSCPGQPCLILSQYIKDSDHYFQSNTVFKFLPGTHHMDRQLHIKDVHNVSMESLIHSNEHPHLVAQFTCEEVAPNDCVRTYTFWLVKGNIHFDSVDMCCTAVHVRNVYNATFKGIDITVQTPNMSGVAFVNVSNINVQLNSACFSSSPTTPSIGVVVLNANLLEIHSSSASNCSCGLQLQGILNSHIINATTMYNDVGMIMSFFVNVTLLNTMAMCNFFSGIMLSFSRYISIINTSALQNDISGIVLGNTFNSTIINTTALQNGGNGIWLDHTNDTTLTNTTALQNGMHALWLEGTTDTTLTNTTAQQNAMHGIWVEDTTDTTLINTTAQQNDWNGIWLDNTTDTTLTNTNALQNGFNGILLGNTTDTTLTNTTAVQNGLDGIVLGDTTETTLINTNVSQNHISGISSYGTKSNTIISNLAAVSNGNEGIIFYNTSKIYMNNGSLMHNGWRREVTTLNGDVLSAADPTTLPAVILLYSSSVHISEFNVTENNVSAVKAIQSNVTASGDVIVSNNRATAGTAFMLLQTSILKLTRNAHIQVANNHAINTGGAFYITSDPYYALLKDRSHTVVEKSSCFFNTEGNRSQSRFTFVNNSAGKGGDILYGGHIFYGLDGDWNCLLSFKNLSNISQNGLSLITSDPSRVCLCNRSGQPDCLITADPTQHSIFAGQSINIFAVVVGQDFGTVSGSVYAQFLQETVTDGSPQLEMGQNVQYVTQEKCNQLNYTIFSSSDMSEGVLVLTTRNARISKFAENIYGARTEPDLKHSYHVHDASALSVLEYGHSPLYVNFSLLPCPTGFMLTTKTPFKCDCNELLQVLQGVKCYIQDQTIGRSGLVWVGTFEEDNETVITSEYCLFDNCNKREVNVTLSDSDSQCNYNHSGTLCGGCQPGLSLALGSSQCLSCSNKYLALLIPFALAGPALVFFIKVLDLTISQGTINGLIFYANIVKANDFTFLPQGQTNPLTLFIAWLNLDLGVETCFFHGLTAYTKTWLQFVFPVYIWSIAGLIIISAKYSDRVAKVMGNNSVPVLATLFLLSYSKLFHTIITAVSYTMLYSSQGHKAVWSADGNVDYLGPKHAPLFAVAVAVLLFLWLPYTLLLFLGQCLHMCNIRLIDRTLMKMKPFLDAHYGPLKGKHYYWFGALLLVRAAVLLISALIPTNRVVILNFSTSICAVVLNYFGVIVYRNIPVAMYVSSFFMNLVLLGLTNFFTTAVGGDQTLAVYILTGIALVQFLGLIIFKTFFILKKCEKVMSCLRKRQPAEDDWELYEQAALLREMESDAEEEDSDECGSVESLPTY